MASPPPFRASSPPNGTPLALPRQRPSIALPTGLQSRNPSAVSTPSGLRQTSYPPEDSQHRRAAANNQEQYSPVDDDSIGDLSDDGEVRSAISGPSNADDVFSKKRKRGEKRSRGRPPKNQTAALFRQGSVSLVNGEDGGKSAGASSRRGGTAGATGSVANGEGEDDEDDEDDAAGRDAKDGFNIDKEELERERERRFLFREAVDATHQNRYDSFNRVKLKQADVRRLVNATLSQSVPQNVVTVVMAYTKMFAGMLIESAREVQDEWMAAEEKRPDGEDSKPFKRLRMMQPDRDEEIDGIGDEVVGTTTSEKTDTKPDEVAQEDKMDITPENATTAPSTQQDLQKTDGEAPSDITKDVSKEPEIKQEKDADKNSPIPIVLKDAEKSNIAEAKPPKESAKVEEGQSPNTQGNTTTSPATTQKDSEQSSMKSQTDAAQQASQTSSAAAAAADDDVTSADNVQPGAGNLAKYLDEQDRGPLLPDHFREALRRYKKARGGGTVGFTGLSLEGKENAAVRLGGRKLFR